MAEHAAQVAVVLKGYPRLSETFIAQELAGLEQRGLRLAIWSLRHPTDGATHPVHDEIAAPVHYLPEYLHDDPVRVIRAWWQARRLPGYRAARRIFLRDLWRDLTRNRLRRFGQALVLAAEAPPTCAWFYAHFLHTPASVTRYAAPVRQIAWSCSAHAKDIYTSPDWELSEKLDDLEWLVTCTAANVTHLKQLPAATRTDSASASTRVSLLYHGLDLTRFPANTRELSPANGAGDQVPVEILSVGRLVEKKGYDDLFAALARLPRQLNWRMTHIGGGGLKAKLSDAAEQAGIAGRITWLGARPQTDVLDAYRRADIFVLASRIADDGDRDGLPNVLMEAQSQRLCCLSTAVSAIPELIVDRETGRLVSPNDPAALAESLESLISQPAERARLAIAGENRVRTHFGHDAGLDQLAARFRAIVPDAFASNAPHVNARTEDASPAIDPTLASHEAAE